MISILSMPIKRFVRLGNLLCIFFIFYFCLKEVEGFLNELQGWNNLFKDKNQKLKTQARNDSYFVFFPLIFVYFLFSLTHSTFQFPSNVCTYVCCNLNEI